MYKISKLAAGSVIAATAALSGPSMALADGYTPKGKVVYERPSDWSGVYFGLSSGYQWSSINVSDPAPPAGLVAIPGGITSDHANGIVGAHLGLQHQFGNIVLGIEGGWLSTFRDRDGSSEACFAPPVLTFIGPGFNCTAQLNDILTIGPRVGWAAGHWMPYVTGGYANAGFDFTARSGIVPAGSVVEQAHTRLNGWYVGGGFEWKISPGWTAGLEYRHYEFAENTVQAFSPIGVPLEQARFDATTDTVTARVSWRFNREVVTPLK